MEPDKYLILKEALGATRHAIIEEADEEVIIELVDLCGKVVALARRNKRKRLWMKPWRAMKNDRGSFSFLTKELLLSDPAGYNNYLRLNKSQFELLLRLIQPQIERSSTLIRETTSAAEKLALTLRFLATGESFISLNYQSRLSASFICRTIPEVCEAIYGKLKESFLQVPSNALEWELISKEFAIKWQFPNCLGALDGKHINFRVSRTQGAFYHNYKGTNSIILLALVDANCRFLFVDVGTNGRANDAGVLQRSPLKQILENEESLPRDSAVGRRRNLPYVVVADDAFPLQRHIMKPYPYHSNNKKKQIYNLRLSRARHVVEHAFGILCNRFRVFLTTMNVKVETVEKITLACIVLHNFVLQADHNYINSYTSNSSTTLSTASDGLYNPRKGEAERIRQDFTEYFCEEGKLDWVNQKLN